MLNFIKENGYMIFRMIVNQIGMTMFGLMLSMATIQNDTLLLITSLFSIVFYMALLYTMTWDCGLKEKVRVDAKRLKYSPLKGLWMSLCANSLNVLIGIFAVVSRFFVTDFANQLPEAAFNAYYIARSIAIFTQGMYSGLIALYAPYNPFALVLIVIPALVSCTVGYYFGLRDIRILGFFSNKNKPKT
ncbi:MAG: hypothetical protein PUE85_06335 [Firmicutes bacterium]|nr:hypothetical protein [Bacillota bacterium]